MNGDNNSTSRDDEDKNSNYKKNGEEASTAVDIPKWSWIGHRSPLLDTREEAEWILDKLEQKLREELQAVVREGGSGQDALRRVEEEERQKEQKKASGYY